MHLLVSTFLSFLLAIPLISQAGAQCLGQTGFCSPAIGAGGGGAPTYLVSGPSTGASGVPSTNFTVTVGTGTFSGAETFTIADGSHGGTITPSVGSPGTNTVTVTPTVSTTTFTFTYTPVSTGTKTLSFTNGQAWTDASPLSYVVTASAYAGPGDVVSGALAWWGLRAYNLSYASSLGKIANVCTPADAVCADVFSDGTGNFNLAGASTLTCNNTTSLCTVKKLYDQSGNSNCGGPCDVSNVSSIGSRPVLVVNCIGSKPCMIAGISQKSANYTATVSQPFTLSTMSQRTNQFTSSSVIAAASTGAQCQALTANTTNAVEMYCTSAIEYVTAADSVAHTLQFIFNGASSVVYVDTTSTVVAGSPGTTAFGQNAPLLFPSNDSTWVNLWEAGWWGTGFSGGQSLSMHSNQCAYWGTSC